MRCLYVERTERTAAATSQDLYLFSMQEPLAVSLSNVWRLSHGRRFILLPGHDAYKQAHTTPEPCQGRSIHAGSGVSVAARRWCRPSCRPNRAGRPSCRRRWSVGSAVRWNRADRPLAATRIWRRCVGSASILAPLPAAMLVATGAPRVKVGAALPPLVTAGRSPAGPFASVVDRAGRSCRDGRWPAAPRTVRTRVSLAHGRTHP